MSRFLSALVASVAVFAFSTPAFAQMSASPAPMMAKSPKPMKSPKAMKSPMAMASPMSMKKSSKSMSKTTSCPTGESMVSGYTKANGTKVAPYCRKSASKM